MFEAIKVGIYEPEMEYPKQPKKPYLAKGHTSIQALEYAEELVVYEQEIEKYKKEMAKYRQKQNECHAQFRKDALEYAGIDAMHPKADRAFSMAWDRGHSSGLHEVVQNLEELAELLT